MNELNGGLWSLLGTYRLKWFRRTSWGFAIRTLVISNSAGYYLNHSSHNYVGGKETLCLFKTSIPRSGHSLISSGAAGGSAVHHAYVVKAAVGKRAHYPANKKHLYNICTTAAQRLRRWSNIVQMFYKYFVFTGYDNITILGPPGRKTSK